MTLLTLLEATLLYHGYERFIAEVFDAEKRHWDPCSQDLNLGLWSECRSDALSNWTTGALALEQRIDLSALGRQNILYGFSPEGKMFPISLWRGSDGTCKVNPDTQFAGLLPTAMLWHFTISFVVAFAQYGFISMLATIGLSKPSYYASDFEFTLHGWGDACAN